ncbi:hypothetical protein AACH06_21900 [Ideonella sp. DXS29W]|uniref:Uncharacterized protein n=1 Tax=Ideonella lacteola TaxID=2984193 RepID=A0ABU9BVK0_9BURK
MWRLLFLCLIASAPALSEAQATWRRPITAPQDFLAHEPEQALELSAACRATVAPRLAAARVVRLAAADISALEACTKAPVAQGGKLIHAVRAVRIGGSGGDYQVYFNKTEVFVFHGSFDKLPMADAVVLVAADVELTDAFADAATLD